MTSTSARRCSQAGATGRASGGWTKAPPAAWPFGYDAVAPTAELCSASSQVSAQISIDWLVDDDGPLASAT
ncbi:MAG: hypothetical protein ACK5ME_13920 [Parahaliea sp.]